MSAAQPEIGVFKRRQIEHLWDRGLDTFEIAIRVDLPQHQVALLVSAYVTAKNFRKSAF